MPRFYFDLISKSGAVIDSDDEGGEFPDLAAATRDAEAGLAEMIAEALVEGRPVDFAAISLRDEDGGVLETLRFDEKGTRLDIQDRAKDDPT